MLVYGKISGDIKLNERKKLVASEVTVADFKGAGQNKNYILTDVPIITVPGVVPAAAGAKCGYGVGDDVLLSFLNNNVTKAVILGKPVQRGTGYLPSAAEAIYCNDLIFGELNNLHGLTGTKDDYSGISLKNMLSLLLTLTNTLKTTVEATQEDLKANGIVTGSDSDADDSSAGKPETYSASQKTQRTVELDNSNYPIDYIVKTGKPVNKVTKTCYTLTFTLDTGTYKYLDNKLVIWCSHLYLDDLTILGIQKCSILAHILDTSSIVYNGVMYRNGSSSTISTIDWSNSVKRTISKVSGEGLGQVDKEKQTTAIILDFNDILLNLTIGLNYIDISITYRCAKIAPDILELTDPLAGELPPEVVSDADIVASGTEYYAIDYYTLAGQPSEYLPFTWDVVYKTIDPNIEPASNLPYSNFLYNDDNELVNLKGNISPTTELLNNQNYTGCYIPQFSYEPDIKYLEKSSLDFLIDNYIYGLSPCLGYVENNDIKKNANLYALNLLNRDARQIHAFTKTNSIDFQNQPWASLFVFYHVWRALNYNEACTFKALRLDTLSIKSLQYGYSCTTQMRAYRAAEESEGVSKGTYLFKDRSKVKPGDVFFIKSDKYAVPDNSPPVINYSNIYEEYACHTGFVTSGVQNDADGYYVYTVEGNIRNPKDPSSTLGGVYKNKRYLKLIYAFGRPFYENFSEEPQIRLDLYHGLLNYESEMPIKYDIPNVQGDEDLDGDGGDSVDGDPPDEGDQLFNGDGTNVKKLRKLFLNIARAEWETDYTEKTSAIKQLGKRTNLQFVEALFLAHNSYDSSTTGQYNYNKYSWDLNYVVTQSLTGLHCDCTSLAWCTMFTYWCFWALAAQLCGLTKDQYSGWSAYLARGVNSDSIKNAINIAHTFMGLVGTGEADRFRATGCPKQISGYMRLNLFYYNPVNFKKYLKSTVPYEDPEPGDIFFVRKLSDSSKLSGTNGYASCLGNASHTGIIYSVDKLTKNTKGEITHIEITTIEGNAATNPEHSSLGLGVAMRTRTFNEKMFGYAKPNYLAVVNLLPKK